MVLNIVWISMLILVEIAEKSSQSKPASAATTVCGSTPRSIPRDPALILLNEARENVSSGWLTFVLSSWQSVLAAAVPGARDQRRRKLGRACD
jgi:hypothetical protein